MSILLGTSYPASIDVGADLTGTTIDLTVVDPDGISTKPVPTRSGTKASLNVQAAKVGTYLLVWILSGNLSGGTTDQFTVEAPQVDLISLGDLKDALSLDDLDTRYDDKLRTYMRTATPIVENVTGPIIPHPRTDYFDGGAERVVLPARWVASITSVVETWGAQNYTLTEQPLGASVDSFGYTWDRNTNTIVRRTYGGAPAVFQPGTRNVAVTYAAGLTPVPADIQRAAAELIRHWYRKNEVFSGGAFGPTSGDDSYNLPGNYDVPNAVMEILTPWRRPPGIY